MKIGGRAYTNGVRLFGKNYSVKAYYDKNDNLRCSIAKNKISDNRFYQITKKIPILRGIISIIFAFIMLFSEVKRNPKRFWPLILILLIDILRIVYFSFFPGSTAKLSFFYSDWFIYTSFIMFIIGLIMLRFTLLKDIFKFHGAEHKAVNYYQNQNRDLLAQESRLARRCGTNLVVVVFILIFLAEYFALAINFYLLTFLTIGLAYEIILILPKSLLSFPFLVQRFTTIEPDERHLKAAELALKMLLHKEEVSKDDLNYSMKGV